MINEAGDIRGYKMLDYNLDNIRTGHFVTRMYELYPEAKNLLAMKTMMKQLEKQPRTNDGVYWHKAIYAYQVWLDGIFMGLPYRVLTANLMTKQGEMKEKAAQKIYNDAVEQILKTYSRTLDPKTGLNRHAWDETNHTFWADKQTGLSQHCWGRAQGWYTMALVELLDALPADYARRAEVEEVLKKDFDAIIKWQDKKTGTWYQVMDSPERKGNYLESTCTSMFAYSMLKAYRKGYVKDVKYRDAGIKAYRGIIKNFIKVHPDKTISLTQCCAVAGLGPAATPEVEAAMKKVNPKGKVKHNARRDGSFEYYLSEPIRDNDAKGVGPFIWASLEMEMMGFDADNITASIDRKAVITRNNPIVNEADPLASLTVGNGHFAATVDVTGLQSFPFDYEAGVPLNTMSDWGWHSFKNTNNLQRSETEKAYDFGHGHKEIYAVEFKKGGGRDQQATEYFRVNPHRLNLGTIGFELKDKSGNKIALKDLKNINQELMLWDGKIESKFTADGTNVEVTTACMQDKDCMFARVKSEMLKDQRATISIKFAYPTGKHADSGADWNSNDKHQSQIVASDKNYATIARTIDGSTYFVTIKWEGDATLKEVAPHHFSLSTTEDILTFCAEYTLRQNRMRPAPFEYDQAHKAVLKAWPRFWLKGAIADFSQCTDPRAKELERRVVLSQYLTYINCANTTAPQETGLTYNTWFGRPHLEMTWWHMVDFSLWNRPEVMKTVLDWYNDVAYPEAINIAKRQGFKGARWMKMTDPWAGEAPSNTGSFLTWQQPHYIYMAEEMYRHNPSKEILNKYGEQVEATAEFMADFAKQCAPKGGKIKLFGQTAMQESMSKDFSYNHPFEQAYWYYGLSVAQKWRERKGLERNAEWDDVISRMASLAEKDGIYTAGEPIKPFNANAKQDDFDPFVAAAQVNSKEISEEDFNLKCRSDHPAVLGACGLLPTTPLYDKDKMVKTLNWVMDNWNWPTTWGWDYGMVAMCAARLGETNTALNALLIDKQKNTYLKNGHNFQEPKRLRLYMPGNGALLTAVAMMCAGWDGSTEHNPGFPKDGKWNVRWEGFQKMQ
jgi:rhamnogalacturonyl hydrolase YesR